MRHPFLLIAGGLAFLCSVGLAFFGYHPFKTGLAMSPDLAIAALALFGATQVGRRGAAILAAVVLVAALSLNVYLYWYGSLYWPTLSPRHQGAFIVAVVGNSLGVPFAALQLIFGWGRASKSRLQA